MKNIMNIQGGKALLASLNEEQQTTPREVFGKFLYEGELGVLFGDSNAGKSILANDIAFFVSGGGHEWEGMESPNIPTLYIDMEMTTKQFATRYHNAADYITDTYYRGEVDIMGTDDERIWAAVKANIIYHQMEENAPKFIIIDNITNGFGSIYSGKKMKDLIFDMKQLKDRFGLTILLIAHCPKRKKNAEITADNLGGSKMILNFVDSAFAIAPSLTDDNLRYIKQIKTRNGQKMSNVMTVKISDEPYLCMEYLDLCKEKCHIEPSSEDILRYELTPELEAKLVKMILDGVPSLDISNTLGIDWLAVMHYADANNLEIKRFDTCF